MNVISFPKKSKNSLAASYETRLDAQNEKVEEILQAAERMNLELMLEMQQYLFLLQQFSRDCELEEFKNFLRTKGGPHHNLQLNIDDDVVFQYVLPF